MLQDDYDLIREFEAWWNDHDTVFGSELRALCAFCEDTGYDFEEVYDIYQNMK